MMGWEGVRATDKLKAEFQRCKDDNLLTLMK